MATQEQNKTLDSYVYDPAGRAMQTTSENTETKALTTTVSHYAGAGNALTWTSEGTEKWSRNIPGIDGTLCAVQTSSSAPVLQLHDLQGNVIATAADNETETKLLSTYNSTEFGVPSEGKTPPKYAWLGASGLSTETSFGTGVATQAGASYVPQVARDLQTAPPIPPGAFPNGQGTGEQYGSEIPGWYISLSSQESANTLAAWTAKQEQLKREAEEKTEEQLAALGAGAEDPGELTFVFTVNMWIKEAQRLETLAARTQLIGLALSIVPAIGEVSGESATAYAEYLRGWADTFRGDAELMKKELVRDKKRKLPLVVYALFEEYINIPALGRFPVYFATDQCEYLNHTDGNTIVFCPGGKYKGFWEVEGEYR